MNYTKILADIANVGEVIKDEDKALILLCSLSNDDYEIFILTLINSKQFLRYNEVSTAFVSHEQRWKDNESSISTSAEAFTVRGRSFNQKGKDNLERLKSKFGLKKNQCAFCKEERH